MNTSILQKCLEELNKENPKIEYIKGMLETFIALAGNPPIITPQNNNSHVTEKIKELVRTESVSDEEAVPDFLRPGRTGNISG